MVRKSVFLGFGLVAAIGLTTSLLVGCGGGGGGGRPGLLLSGATFDGEFKPLPARLFIARPPAKEEDPWSVEVLEAKDGSNVFHKSMYFKPASGGEGILTISGTNRKAPEPAYVKLWRKAQDQWEAETIYEGKFGGDFDRCRDVEVADVDGDGVDEIIVVTHQRGVVLVIDQEGGKYEAKKVASTEESGEDQWIHEVEAGDINGDGTIEFFTTPSAPNTLEGKEQPGRINMYRYQDGEYKETTVEEFTTRHVKEILCGDLDGNGTPLLFAAIEGEEIGGEGSGGKPSQVKLYSWKDGTLEGEIIMDLPGEMCRFLSIADTDGDGTNEIIASTASDGIFSIARKDGGWRKRSVAPGSISAGFEHASIPMDTDGDGKDEIFAVSDNDKTLRRFYFDEGSGRYRSEKLLEFTDVESLFIFNIEPLPSGM